MVELVDTLGSGSSPCTWVGVRVPFRAHILSCKIDFGFAAFLCLGFKIILRIKTKT